MKKVALFAFNGEPMCFVHVLLNALNMKEKGWDVTIVAEGASVTVLPEIAKSANPFNPLYVKTKDAGLFAGVCKACSAKLGVLGAVKELGFDLLDDMQGHPSMSMYMEKGYEIITF